MFPVEILANIGHHLHGDYYLNLLFTNKTNREGMRLHEKLLYELSIYQEKAYQELIISRKQSLTYLSFVETDAKKVIINYIYYHLKREDARILIICENNREFKEMEQVLLTIFEDSAFVIKHPLVLRLLKNKNIVMSRRLNHKIIPVFLPTLLININGSFERYEANVLNNVRYIEFSNDLVVWRELPSIVQMSHIPFPSYTQRCLIERSNEMGISSMIRLHSKFILVDGTKQLMKHLRREGHTIFSSKQKEDYEIAEKGILVYLSEDKPKPKDMSGVVFLHPDDNFSVQYSTLCPNITLLYHLKIAFRATYDNFETPFLLFCGEICSLFNAYAYPKGYDIHDDIALSDGNYDILQRHMTLEEEHGIRCFNGTVEILQRYISKDIHMKVMHNLYRSSLIMINSLYKKRISIVVLLPLYLFFCIIYS